MTGESAELEMVNIRVRRRAGAAPDMATCIHGLLGLDFASSKGVLEKDLLYPGSACFGFHTVVGLTIYVTVFGGVPGVLRVPM